MPDRGRARFQVVKGGAGDFGGSGDMPSVSSGQLGMIIFLVSLGVLFTGTMVAYLIVRFQNASWRTAEQPPLPLGLIASSVLILAASATLAWATGSVRKNKLDAMRHALIATFVLGVAFMAAQFYNWHTLAANNLPLNARSLYSFTFYMLTGVHAIHVVGGFIPLGFCIRNAYRDQYSSLRWNGVKFCAQYWHFLDVVWFVMLITMWSVT